MARAAAKSAPFQVVPLESSHARSTFDCESPVLNRYFCEQVSQDLRRRVAACFVALDADERLAGFCTLASASVPLQDLPTDQARKLPRYLAVPTVRMGRLAVDAAFKGRGLGAALLADALTRAAHAEIAAYALLVDAKDATAAAFYRHHGFMALPDSPLTLFMPLAAVPSA